MVVRVAIVRYIDRAIFIIEMYEGYRFHLGLLSVEPFAVFGLD